MTINRRFPRCKGLIISGYEREPALAKKPTPAAIQELTAVLGDENYNIRYMARATLHQIGGTEMVGVLKVYLQEVDDGPGREEAEKLLGMLT